jgi:hypothetical protein
MNPDGFPPEATSLDYTYLFAKHRVTLQLADDKSWFD